MLGKEFLDIKFATAATGSRTGDTGNALGIGYAFGKKLADLLFGGAAAIANDIVDIVQVIVVHKTV